MLGPEARVKAKVKEALRQRGFVWQFWPVQSGYGEATVDCLALNYGRFYGIECKREGIRKPTPRQAAVMARIRAAGGVTYLVTMKDGELEWIEIK
jgi:hypothetical protein